MKLLGKVKEDLTGRKFGKFIVLHKMTKEESKLYGRYTWLCKCECGNLRGVDSTTLKTGRRKSCGRCNFYYMVGKKYNRLTVINIFIKDNKGTICHCKCDCGNECDVPQYYVNHGIIKSCGCYRDEQIRKRANKLDLIGTKFGRLTVIDKLESRNGTNYWKCLCSCGNITEVRTGHLMNGAIKSCGCLPRELAKKKFTTHGMSCDRFYRIHAGILERCKDKNDIDYGGRGITFTSRWNKFENFKEDMYESYLNHVEEYGEDNTQIDRIDNDGNYEPSNCKWSTRMEQGKNKRNNHIVTLNGKSHILAEWSRILSIREDILKRRIANGWSYDSIINTPTERINNDKE